MEFKVFSKEATRLSVNQCICGYRKILLGLKLKRFTIPNIVKDMEQLELSYIVGENVNLYNFLGTVGQYLLKLNIPLLNNLVILLLNIYNKRLLLSTKLHEQES